MGTNVSLYRTKKVENWTHEDYWINADEIEKTIVENYFGSDLLSNLLYYNIVFDREPHIYYEELYEDHVLFKEDIEHIIQVLNKNDPESIYISKFELLLNLTDWETEVLMYLSKF
jgi:hypothetical protein